MPLFTLNVKEEKYLIQVKRGKGDQHLLSMWHISILGPMLDTLLTFDYIG